VQRLELAEEGLQLVQAQGAGTVALGVVRVRVRLEEQTGQALAHAGLGQIGHLGTASAGGVTAAAGHLQGVGDVEEHRSEEHTSELQSRENLVCRLLLEKKKKE